MENEKDTWERILEYAEENATILCGILCALTVAAIFYVQIIPKFESITNLLAGLAK